MFDIIYAPVQAIHNAHKGRITKPLLYLAVLAVVNCIAGILLTAKFVVFSQALILGGILLAATFIVPWIIAAVLMVVLNIMDTDSIGYYESFTCVVYAEVPKVFGLFIAALFLFIPLIGPVVAGLAIAAGTVLYIAILIRAIKELFGTDLLHALVGLLVSIGFFIAVSAVIASTTLMQAAFVLIASQF